MTQASETSDLPAPRAPTHRPAGPDAAVALVAEELPPALLTMMMMANRVMTMEAVRSHPAARLTPPQFRILNFLYTQPGASLSEVAAYLGVRLPTASVMLVKLAAEGHVLRARHPESRRRMMLLLTDQGRGLITSVRDTLFHRLEGGLHRLDPAERNALAQAIPALRRLLTVV